MMKVCSKLTMSFASLFIPKNIEAPRAPGTSASAPLNIVKYCVFVCSPKASTFSLAMSCGSVFKDVLSERFGADFLEDKI